MKNQSTVKKTIDRFFNSSFGTSHRTELFLSSVDEDVLTYLNSKPVANISRLTIGTSDDRKDQENISDESLKLLSRQLWSHLLGLTFYSNISSKGMQILSQNVWNNLLVLYLNGSKIESKGVKYLSRCTSDSLQKIYLKQNQIDNTGLVHFMKMPFRKLKILNLVGNRIKIHELKKLSRGNLVALSQLFLHKQKTENSFSADLALLNSDSLLTLLTSGNKTIRQKKILEPRYQHISNLDYDSEE